MVFILFQQENFSIGLLVSYLAYATYFYNPLRQLALYGRASRWQWQAGTGLQKFLSLNTDLSNH